MADKWVVNPEYPEGCAVALTADEEAQRAADDAEGLASAAAELAREANDRTIRDRLTAALDVLENPTTWPPRTQAEKIEALRRVNAALIRLLLRRLETTG